MLPTGFLAIVANLSQPIGFPWLEQKVTEWGCMQALIDFEGWRKWRGFADTSRPSATARTANGPMQINDSGEPQKPGPSSPAESRSTATLKAEGAGGAKQYAEPPRPTDSVAREDSSGSGGSGSTDTLDSPAKPMVTANP